LKTKLYINRVFLSAVFLLGSAVLFVPISSSKDGDFLPFVISFTLSLLFYFLWSFLADKFYALKSDGLSFKIFLPFIVAFCLVASTVTIKSFTSYVWEDILIENTKISIAVVFAIVLIFTVLKSEKALSKFSVTAFVFCFLSIIILFLVSVDNFSNKNINSLFGGNVYDWIKNGLCYFLRVFICPFVFAFYSRFAFNEKNNKSDFLGFFLGFVMLALCYLNSALIFSIPYAAKMKFSYPLSISVVSVGNLFTRMDGFAYFIIFFSCLLKSTLSIITIKLILRKANVKKVNLFSAFFVLVSAFLGYIL